MDRRVAGHLEDVFKSEFGIKIEIIPIDGSKVCYEHPVRDAESKSESYGIRFPKIQYIEECNIHTGEKNTLKWHHAYTYQSAEQVWAIVYGMLLMQATKNNQFSKVIDKWKSGLSDELLKGG